MIKHGLSGHVLYHIWDAMKDRCYNPKSKQYLDYGGRGIFVCEEWVNNPEVFIKWAIANGWKKGLTIEREENVKGYSPINCKFITMALQSRNKRSNVYVMAFGENKCIADWIKDSRCVVNFGTLRLRIGLGWNSEKAITTMSKKKSGFYHAFGEYKSIINWSKDERCVVSLSGLGGRLRKNNWEIEKAILTPAFIK